MALVSLGREEFPRNVEDSLCIESELVRWSTTGSMLIVVRSVPRTGNYHRTPIIVRYITVCGNGMAILRISYGTFSLIRVGY